MSAVRIVEIVFIIKFTKQVGEGVYWIITTQCVDFITCLLNTVGVFQVLSVLTDLTISGHHCSTTWEVNCRYTCTAEKDLWSRREKRLLVAIRHGIKWGTLKGGPQLADRTETADHIHRDATDLYAPCLKLCCCLCVRS